MSPAHANKKGVRYRYYVSQAILRGRKTEAGSVGRVSGPDLEAIVVAALRRDAGTLASDEDDATLVQNFVRRVTLRRDYVDLATISADAEATALPNLIEVPFRQKQQVQSGIGRAPPHGTMDPETRDTLLTAMVRAIRWFDELLSGEAASTDAIASAEGLAERYVRRLLPPAFLSPRIVEAIDQGLAPGSLTIAELTRSLPHEWAVQETRFLS